MAVWGCLTNSCDKKRIKKQRRKGKIYPFEYRVPKKSKEGQPPPPREDAQLLPLGSTHCAEPSGQTNVLSSTFLSPQCSPQHSPLGAVKSPQHISLPPSPNNHYFLPPSSGAQGEEHRVSSPVSSQVCTAQVRTGPVLFLKVWCEFTTAKELTLELCMGRVC